MKNKIITILLCLVFFSCENEYKPKLEYPVVYIDTTEGQHARWSSPVKVIILKDRIGDEKYIYTQRSFCSRWADSIYKNCKIGDTVNYPLPKDKGASEVNAPTNVGNSFRFLGLRSTDK